MGRGRDIERVNLTHLILETAMHEIINTMQMIYQWKENSIYKVMTKTLSSVQTVQQNHELEVFQLII